MPPTSTPMNRSPIAPITATHPWYVRPPVARRPMRLPCDDARQRARGDEEAFTALVRRCSPTMMRVARMYVPTAAVAEEVVQETWLGRAARARALRGALVVRRGSSGSSSTARGRAGCASAATVPFAVARRREETDDDGPAVDPSRFVGPGRPRGRRRPRALAGGSRGARCAPRRRVEIVARRDRRAARDAADGDHDARPRGPVSDEVRNVLELTETNQRVLLHRARPRCAQALEDWIADA